MKIVWVVSIRRSRCIHDTFAGAWADFWSHDFGTAKLYPRLMSKEQLEALKEFYGW